MMMRGLKSRISWTWRSVIAAADRDHGAAQALGAVVGAEAAGEQAVAVGDVADVAGPAAGGADRAGHQVGPVVDVAARVADDGGLARGAAGGVDAHDLLARHGEQAERVGVAQVGLLAEREPGQVLAGGPGRRDARRPSRTWRGRARRCRRRGAPTIAAARAAGRAARRGSRSRSVPARLASAAHHWLRSTIIAMPWPTPMHMVHKRVAAAGAVQLVDGGGDQARTAHAERVADGDGSAVRVHVRRVVGQAELAQHGQRLRGERLVELDHVHLVERAARPRQHLARRRHRARCP